MADTDLNVKLTLLDGVSNQLKEINNNISSQTSDMKSNFGALSKAMQEVGVSMIAMGTAIVAQLTLITKTFVDTGTQLTQLSETLGFTTSQLSEWGYVAEQNGTTLDSLSSHIVYLSRSISDISGGSDVAQKALKDLGFTLGQLQAMSPDQQFTAVTEAIANQSDATERLALATSIFGRGAMDLMPILAQGTAGIQAEMQQAQQLGIVMGTDASQQAQNFSRALTDLKDSFKGLADTIGPIITSVIQPLIEKITQIIEGINNWAKAHPALVKALTDTALVLGPLLISFGTLFTLASTLIITLPILGGAVMSLVPSITSLGGAVVFLAGAVGLLTLGLGMIALGVVGLISNMGASKQATDATTTAVTQHRYAVGDETQAIIDSDAAIKAQTQAYWDNVAAATAVSAQIEKLASDYNNSQTEAGKLGLTIDDVTNYLLKQGDSAQQVYDIYVKFGTDVNDIVNGLNLNWNSLYISVDANVAKLVSSFDSLNSQAKTFNDQLEAWDQQEQAALGPTADATAQALANSAAAAESNFWNITHTTTVLPGVNNVGAMSLSDWQNELSTYTNAIAAILGTSTGHAGGGIFDSPHMAQIAEGGMPEAVLPLNRDMSLTPRAQQIMSAVPAGGSGLGSTTLNSTHNITLTLDGNVLAKFVNKQTGLATQQRQNM